MTKAIRTPKIEWWMDPEVILLKKMGEEYLKKVYESGFLPCTRILEACMFPNSTSSAVYKISSDNGVFVVKIYSSPQMLEKEVHFLQKWRTLGIKTPRIIRFYKEVTNFRLPILIMSFVRTPKLSDLMNPKKMIKMGVAREIGRVSAKMHMAKGVGFGSPSGTNLSRGPYKTFTEEVERDLGNKFKYLLSLGVIDKETINCIKMATQIIEKHIENGMKPSLIHNDLRPYNIFATKPITVFDPIPRITHPYICLSLTLSKAIIESGKSGREEFHEILRGYQELASLKMDVLNAAMLIRTAWIIHTWVNKGKDKQVLLGKELLNKYTHLLPKNL